MFIMPTFKVKLAETMHRLTVYGSISAEWVLRHGYIILLSSKLDFVRLGIWLSISLTT